MGTFSKARKIRLLVLLEARKCHNLAVGELAGPVVEPATSGQEEGARQHARLCRVREDDANFDGVVADADVDGLAGEDDGIVVRVMTT